MAMTRVCEVAIEALGDDFAQVSGVWLEGTRVAAHLEKAGRIWAFAAPDGDAAAALLAELPCGDDERVIGIAPGAQMGWMRAERAKVFALLGEPPEESAVVGLAMAIPAPDCAACRGDGICGGCGTIADA